MLFRLNNSLNGSHMHRLSYHFCNDQVKPRTTDEYA